MRSEQNNQRESDHCGLGHVLIALVFVASQVGFVSEMDFKITCTRFRGC